MQINKDKLKGAIQKIITNGILTTEKSEETASKVVTELIPLITALERMSKKSSKLAEQSFREGFNAAIRFLEEAKKTM